MAFAQNLNPDRDTLLQEGKQSYYKLYSLQHSYPIRDINLPLSNYVSMLTTDVHPACCGCIKAHEGEHSVNRTHYVALKLVHPWI